MKTGKSKCIKCDFQKENTYTPKDGGSPVTNYAFSVAFEDGISGLYNAKDKNKPKFIVGQEFEYTAEEKQGSNGVWYIIKPKQEPFQKGGFREKPVKDFTIDLATKMFNSSQNTKKPYEFKQLLPMSDWMVGQLNSGVSRVAMEIAVRIQCAKAVRENNPLPINSEELASELLIIDQWLKK